MFVDAFFAERRLASAPGGLPCRRALADIAKSGRICLVMILLSVTVGSALAEWQTFTSGDGLIFSTVLCGLEDSRERLWFGTSHGVSCFDGVGWRNYGADTTFGDVEVNTIIEASDGTLWFGTSEGLRYLRDETWGVVPFEEAQRWYWVYSVCEDRTGALWVSQSYGVYTYRDGIWTPQAGDGLLESLGIKIICTRNGSLWFATDHGIVQRDASDGRWHDYATDDGLPNELISDLLETRDGTIYAGSGDAVCRFRPDGRWEPLFDLSQPLAYVLGLAEDGRGCLWVTSGEGLARWDGRELVRFTDEDGLSSMSILDVFVDRAGNVWASTNGSGVCRFDCARWVQVTHEDGVPGALLYGFLLGRNGSAWFLWAQDRGSSRVQISEYAGRAWTVHDPAGNGRYGDLFEAGDESIWIADISWEENGSGDVYRYTGTEWTAPFKDAPCRPVNIGCIAQDKSNAMWFSSARSADGLWSYDGATCRHITTQEGLPTDSIGRIYGDRDGNLWAAESCSNQSDAVFLYRYDGREWTTFATSEELGGQHIEVIYQAQDSSLWVGTYGGYISRYRNGAWERLKETSSVGAEGWWWDLFEDKDGNMWFGASDGLWRFDGQDWVGITRDDGFPGTGVAATAQDSLGRLWLATTESGIAIYEPDRVPPQTVISSPPPRLSPNRSQPISFQAAFGESRRIQFSYSLDSSVWSPWSPATIWSGSNLIDGTHRFEVRARDAFGNVDSTAAAVEFEIDGTTPVPILTTPPAGATLMGSVDLQGTAADPRFARYFVLCRPSGRSTWDTLFVGQTETTAGLLATIDTRRLPDGDYDLRLGLADALGLEGSFEIPVVIDNEAPWEYETSPVHIPETNGGYVYAADASADLYVPPHAFQVNPDAFGGTDTEVRLQRLAPGDFPPLPQESSGAIGVYGLTWERPLLKQATLRLRCDGGATDSVASPVLYLLQPGSTWQRIGGTFDPSTLQISAPVQATGTYALLWARAGLADGTGLRAMTLTPRAFSPIGRTTANRVAVGFHLGRPSTATLRIYNRAGRLVREIDSRGALAAGTHLLEWDGRDPSGEVVIPGIYVVHLQAAGNTQTGTCAVVP